MVEKLAFPQDVLCAFRNPDDVLGPVVLIDFADLLVDVPNVELVLQLLRIILDLRFSVSQGFDSRQLLAFRHKFIVPPLQV